jgi:uncharacterized protein
MSSKITRQEILDLLQARMSGIRQRFGVRELAIFGSVARGDANDGSDVDVLVTFDKRAQFDCFMDLKFYLEELLSVRVDLVTPKALRAQMRTEIEREAVRVA